MVFDGLDCESLWCLGVALRDYNGERLAVMADATQVEARARVSLCRK